MIKQDGSARFKTGPLDSSQINQSKLRRSNERVWILLEDDETITKMMITVMELVWKIRPLSFTTGEEALAWLNDVESGKYTGAMPELALLDIRVPGIVQGHEVAYALRQAKQTADMVIVIGTGFAFSQDDKKAIVERARPDLFLNKPYPGFDEMKKILDVLLV